MTATVVMMRSNGLKKIVQLVPAPSSSFKHNGGHHFRHLKKIFDTSLIACEGSPKSTSFFKRRFKPTGGVEQGRGSATFANSYGSVVRMMKWHGNVIPDLRFQQVLPSSLVQIRLTIAGIVSFCSSLEGCMSWTVSPCCFSKDISWAWCRFQHPKRASLAEQRVHRHMMDFRRNVLNTTPIPLEAGEDWRCRYGYGYGLDDSDLPERTDLGNFRVVDCETCQYHIFGEVANIATLGLEHFYAAFGLKGSRDPSLRIAALGWMLPYHISCYNMVLH